MCYSSSQKRVNSVEISQNINENQEPPEKEADSMPYKSSQPFSIY
jgi:hypothetical protein